MKIVIIKQHESTVFLFMTSDNTCIISRLFQLKNENHVLSKTEKLINRNVPTPPTHQVNVSRKWVCVRWILANVLGHL